MSNRVSVLKRIVDSLIDARERAARREIRQYLRGFSDRHLEDMGFSRELLEQGPRAWPWRAPVEPYGAPKWAHGRNPQGSAHASDQVGRDGERAGYPVNADEQLAA